MKKIILLFAVVFCFSSSIFGQALRSDTISIAHISINLNIVYLSQKKIAGDAELRIKAKINNVTRINLDLLKLNIDSIFIGNQQITSWNYNDTLLSIPLSTSLNIGDSIIAKVYYHGQPVVDPSAWGGFYFSSDSLYAFNLGVGFFDKPHNYGRAWFPCIDDFHNRSTFDYFITVKNNKTAVCNGTLISVSENINAQTKTFNWKLVESIPSYLASVAVGPYVAVQDTFVGMNASIPIAIYVPSLKVVAAQGTFSRLKQILAAYEWAYGPYRWERVGYVAVPFNSGAMEHSTNIAIGLGYINGSSTYESLYAHELSHEWLGDLVTTNSAAEMWINEGWAVFSEALYREILDGKTSYKDYMRHLVKSVIETAHKDDNGYLDLNTVPHEYTYGTTVYDKGATVAHSIRGYLGDSLFFPMLRNYFAQNAFNHISNNGFRDFITNNSGIDMTDFFNSWIKEPGFIQFSIDSFSLIPSANPEYDVKVFLRQKLNHKPTFSNSNRVEVAFFDNSWHRKDFMVEFSGETGNAIFTIPFSPDFAIIDPNEKLADATTDYLSTVKTIGLKYFDDALFRLDVQQINDSALLSITHNWAAPDTLGTTLPGLKLSSRHYWTVKGIFPSNFTATGRFFYTKFTDQDDDIIVSPSDSLVILWRKGAGDHWHKVAFEKKGSWQTGYIYVNNLRQGEYALAVWNQQYVAINENTANLSSLNISPNPSSGKVKIEINSLNSWKLEIYDNLGKTLDTIFGDKSKQINYKIKNEASNGLYYFKLKSTNGNLIDIKKLIITK